MTERRRKRLFATFSAMFLLAVSFVTADYLGLFGLEKYLVLDLAEASFKPVDEATGAPILGVVMTCFQTGNNQACAQKENRETGIITARFPVQKVVFESLFFRKKETRLATENQRLSIMFIHNDYNNVIKEFDVDALHGNTVVRHPVELRKSFE